MSINGLLFVFGEAGEHVSEDEFNDWHDNEFVPARLTVPGIKNALRYKAVDGERPTHLTIFEALSPADLQSDANKLLSAQSTDPERSLNRKLEVSNHRIYELFETKADHDDADLLAKYNHPVLLSVPLDLDQEFNKWYAEEHIPQIAKVPGWLRTRRYKLVSAVELGRKASPDDSPVYNYLTLHDFEREDFFTLPEFQATLHTPWAQKVIAELIRSGVIARRFGLYKENQ